ncbi:MAG: hypothetical protein H0A75_06835 [Candidatus Methanofishera endochildressiae]|uniref:Uncharacterized protein n=1 Tax=Candidatus Methanofishera endochildressiae TaxID=2738884 RepID=A0A7Z0MP73_9GAMM|nr:hypothetical protein [Candidatus Methanofishera endochildressiae]
MRYYPSNNGYLYVENLHVYFYKSDDYMAHYGTLDYWLYHSGIAGEEARKKEARRQEALQEEVWEYDAHQEEDEWDE